MAVHGYRVYSCFLRIRLGLLMSWASLFLEFMCMNNYGFKTRTEIERFKLNSQMVKAIADFFSLGR